MEKRSAAPVKMMPAHRVKLMSEGNTNEEFGDDATKTMASHYVRNGHKGPSSPRRVAAVADGRFVSVGSLETAAP
jgi:hypothetical protein